LSGFSPAMDLHKWKNKKKKERNKKRKKKRVAK